jgi:hypothetical protein
MQFGDCRQLRSLKPHEAVACGDERLILVPIGVLSVGGRVGTVIEFDDADY